MFCRVAFTISAGVNWLSDGAFPLVDPEEVFLGCSFGLLEVRDGMDEVLRGVIRRFGALCCSLSALRLFLDSDVTIEGASDACVVAGVVWCIWFNNRADLTGIFG